MMQSVSKFSTNAFKVSGPCDDLFQMLPDTVHLQGRIGYSQVWDYIRQLRHSTSRVCHVIRCGDAMLSNVMCCDVKCFEVISLNEL